MPDFTYYCLWYIIGRWTAQLVQVAHDANGLTLTFFATTGTVETAWTFPRSEPAYWRWLFWALQVRAGEGQLLTGKIPAYTLHLPDEIMALAPAPLV